MKKLIALLLVLVMVIGLVACGAKEEAATETAVEEVAEEVKEEVKEEAAEEAVEEAAEPKEIVTVDYYCSIGAYLAKLQELVNEFNAGEGAEKGVNINIISNINTYSEDLQKFMETGTFFDLIDAGTSKTLYVEKGYVQDIEAIAADYPEMAELIDGYREYITEGVFSACGVLYTLPLEVVPIKFVVNTGLFEQCGLDYPETWADIVECAKVITENTEDGIYGMGWSTWSACYRRLTQKATMNSTEVGWWDPNTATYSFSQYKTQYECLREMYTNGWMLGADDLAIDPIRSEFAAGHVGMFVAPSYDYAVYTTQFICADYGTEWDVIDVPAVTEGSDVYKGVYLDRAGCSISAPCWEAADDAKKQAIVDAFVFLNSDYVNGAVYEMGGMIPYKTEVIANANVSEDLGPQWAKFADISNYTSMFCYPDALLDLGGADNYNTAFAAFIRDPSADYDTLAAELEELYNNAYAELKSYGETDLSIYEYDYKH